MRKSPAPSLSIGLICICCLISILFAALQSYIPVPKWRNLRRLTKRTYPDAIERKRLALAQLAVMQHNLKDGETLYAVLLREGISAQEVHSFIGATREVMDLTRTAPGDTLKLWRHPGHEEIQRLEFRQLASGCTLIAARTPMGFNAEKLEPKRTVELALAQGSINSSLYADAVSQGMSPKLVMELSDIFAWDIDFLTDLQPGDTFRVIYERMMADGKFDKPGRVLAAEFVNNGEAHTAYYFDDGTGHADYYDARGQSLRKEFLISPVRFKRITSFFSRGRFHPILKIVRPHLGVDYSAPQGTPVEAVADGYVTYAGWQNGFGKVVRIRHKKGFLSSYGHLSAIDPGIRTGAHVKQGEMIGRVGRTGLATGSHLDFRLAMNGTWVDPLKKRSSPAEPVPVAARGRFQSLVQQVNERFLSPSPAPAY